MPRLNIAINLDNDAFQPEAGPEAARILHKLANRIAEWELIPGTELKLFDRNGNDVGAFVIKRDSKPVA